MEHLELTVGQYTFTALADGPADGELVLLLHGFPETSYEWRAQIPALGAAGYRVVAPDQRGYAGGARPAERRRTTTSIELVADAVGFADASAPNGATSSATTGAAPSPGFAGGNHPDRLRTLTVGLDAAPDALPASRSPRRRADARSRRTWTCSGPTSAEDRVPRRRRRDARRAPVRRCTPPRPSPSTTGCFTADGGAAITGGLNWYRANDFAAAASSPDHGAHDVRVVDRRRGARAGGGRGHRRLGRVGRTGSRCSRA